MNMMKRILKMMMRTRTISLRIQGQRKLRMLQRKRNKHQLSKKQSIKRMNQRKIRRPNNLSRNRRNQRSKQLATYSLMILKKKRN